MVKIGKSAFGKTQLYGPDISADAVDLPLDWAHAIVLLLLLRASMPPLWEEVRGLLTVHMVVRNEPLAPLALRAALRRPEVRAIVVDAGSDEEYWRMLRRICLDHKNRVVYLRLPGLPDATGWSYREIGQAVRWPCAELHEILAAMTTTEYIWIVDGDEVYSPVLTDLVVNRALVGLPADANCGFVPLVWLSAPRQRVVAADPVVGSWAGRLFRKAGRRVLGEFPHEQAWYSGKVLQHGQLGALDLAELKLDAVLCHYEPMLKPWRRQVLGTETWTGWVPFEEFNGGPIL